MPISIASSIFFVFLNTSLKNISPRFEPNWGQGGNFWVIKQLLRWFLSEIWWAVHTASIPVLSVFKVTTFFWTKSLIIYLQRFNLNLQQGVTNWLFSYSVASNPDKMSICEFSHQYYLLNILPHRSQPQHQHPQLLSEWLKRVWKLFSREFSSSQDQAALASHLHGADRIGSWHWVC